MASTIRLNSPASANTPAKWSSGWQVGAKYSSWRYRRENGDATVWRCPLYVPKQPSTLKRLIHLGSFALSSFFPLMAQRRWKPDRIIGVVPTLFCTPGMRLLAKLSGARTLLHIQDYEVDAMLGLGMAGNGRAGKVAKLASAFERSGLHNVDNASTITRSMMNKACENGRAPEKVIFFPNWSEVSRFREVPETLVMALRQRLGLPDERKIILYSGNIGEKQGLESVNSRGCLPLSVRAAVKRGWKKWSPNAGWITSSSCRCSRTKIYPRCWRLATAIW